jgi:hypothetical protein
MLLFDEKILVHEVPSLRGDTAAIIFTGEELLEDEEFCCW